MLVLTRAEVERLYTMADAFAAVERAAVAWTTGQADVPTRSALHAGESGLEALVMPGVVGGKYAGTKIWYAGSGSPRLPASSALIVLVDPGLGEVVMDGSVITDLRTGAMTGVAARVLAPRRASVAAIIGAGIQARAQAHALVHALPGLRELRITSRRAQSRTACADELRSELAEKSPQLVISTTDDAEAACRGSDVIVAATTSRHPVVFDEWVGAETLVCGVGSHSPDAAEIDPAIVRRAGVVAVDTRRGAIDGAGDIAPVIAEGGLERDRVLELGDLVATPPTGIAGPRVLKTVGFAAADLVSAHSVAVAAVESGIGRRLAIH